MEPTIDTEVERVLKEDNVDVNANTSIRVFASGAIRDTKHGKGRYDLLPVKAIEALAKHCELGAMKYGERNWEKGIPSDSFMDSGIRHAFNALMGKTDEEHLIAAAWNFLCCYELKNKCKRTKRTKGE